MPKVVPHPRLRSHTRKSKSGKVRVYYFYDMRPDGKADIPLGTDYAEAIEAWTSLHEHKPRTIGRLQEAIDRWRQYELPAYESEETKKGYAKQLRQVEAVLGGMTWDEITLPIMREYLDRREAKTQGNREMSLLSIVWGRARLWGMTRLPWPAQGVKNWKNPEKPRMFDVTDELFAAVYAEAEPMLRDALDIATATGMRLTDVRTVRLPAGDKLRLKANKTGKAADFDVTLSAVLPDLVRRRRALGADHVMLLSMPDGWPVTKSNLRGAYDRARLAAAAKHPALASQIEAMFLRDMRKRASDLSADVDDASALLQHGDTRITELHYRTRVTQLKPVR